MDPRQQQVLEDPRQHQGLQDPRLQAQAGPPGPQKAVGPGPQGPSATSFRQASAPRPPFGNPRPQPRPPARPPPQLPPSHHSRVRLGSLTAPPQAAVQARPQPLNLHGPILNPRQQASTPGQPTLQQSQGVHGNQVGNRNLSQRQCTSSCNAGILAACPGSEQVYKNSSGSSFSVLATLHRAPLFVPVN